jgi:hypothetical protein
MNDRGFAAIDPSTFESVFVIPAWVCQGFETFVVTSSPLYCDYSNGISNGFYHAQQGPPLISSVEPYATEKPIEAFPLLSLRGDRVCNCQSPQRFLHGRNKVLFHRLCHNHH